MFLHLRSFSKTVKAFGLVMKSQYLYCDQYCSQAKLDSFFFFPQSAQTVFYDLNMCDDADSGQEHDTDTLR